MANKINPHNRAKMGVEPMTLTTAAFDARIAKETPIAVEVANAAGVGLKK